MTRVVRKPKPAAEPEPVNAFATEAAPAAPVVGLASIPDASILDWYINRECPGKVTEFDLFDFALRNKRNVLIEGPTGPGKTTAVMAYAASRGMRFYSVSSSIGIEPSQLFGKYIPAADGSFVWQDGPVTDLVRHGGVLLLNEVNFIPERVGTVLFSLLDKRREIQLVDHKGEVIKAHPDLLIVADMNPDYEGTRPLNKAFRNRFADQLHWDYDPKVEASIVRCGSLLQMAKQFRDAISQGQYETPVSTNMLVEFEVAALDLGYDYAAVNFVTHFASDERPAAKGVVDTWSANIKSDLAALIAARKRAAQKDEPKAVSAKTETNLSGEVLNDYDWDLLAVEWVYEDTNQRVSS